MGTAAAIGVCAAAVVSVATLTMEAMGTAAALGVCVAQPSPSRR
jgi:hypothetical protein